MRADRTFLLAAALVLLAPAVAAQEDACVEAEPCQWIVDLDADGIASDGDPEPSFNATQGDWFIVSFYNFDEVAHTVRLDGHDLSWDVAANEALDSQPFQLTDVGEFAFVDETADDQAPVMVFDEDVVAREEEGDAAEDGDGRSVPSLGIAAAAAALAAAAFLTRRRL